MSKKEIWTCDICKKDFEHRLSNLNISIRTTNNGYIKCHYANAFGDVCINCREKILIEVNSLYNKLKQEATNG